MSVKDFDDEFEKRKDKYTKLIERVNKLTSKVKLSQKQYQAILDNIQPWKDDFNNWSLIHYLVHKKKTTTKEEEAKANEQFKQDGITYEQVAEKIDDSIANVDAIIDEVLEENEDEV